ncbi:hypothetical protein [Sulfitobacter sp. HI0054]|uniref:hypothetical protein n=1 Tax=Sulfitobacter sp. HI0054 TaxID=1822238 RepID=UPI0012E7767B|nr:hypothetical protein [Sulfitobacter sp. HI0054]
MFSVLLIFTTLVKGVEFSLLTAVFFAPWQALELDLGVSISLSQLVAMSLFLRLISTGSANFSSKQFSLALIVLTIGVLSSLITLMVYTRAEDGIGRVLVSTSVFVFSFVAFFCANSERTELELARMIKCCVYSGLSLGLLAIIQAVIYGFTGNDIFPIGLFRSEEASRVTAIARTFSGEFFRASSLAGEPKSLGMFTSVAAIVLLLFWRLFPGRYLILAILLLSSLLSNSSSAFFVYGVGTVCYLLRIFKLPIRGSVYFALFAVISAATVLYVSSVPLISYHSKFAIPDTFFQLLYQRSFGRMEVEDTDYVIVASMLHDPLTFLLGKGAGLTHVGIADYVPNGFSYLSDFLIAPKSGAVFIFASFGLLGAIPFILLFASVGKIARFSARQYGSRELDLAVPYLLLFLFSAFLLRVYLFELVLLVFGFVFVNAKSRFHSARNGYNR